MRINLRLDYVLRRSCDYGRPWVAWNPQTGFTIMGRDPATALFLIRDTVRAWVEEQIHEGKHPRRGFSDKPEDEDWGNYQEFLGRFSVDDDPECDRWSRAYGQKYLPEYVDLAFTHIEMDVETFGRHCIINDSWYNEFWYKNDGMVDVTALVEMTYKVDRHSAETDPEKYIHRHWGHTIQKIVGVKSRDPKDPR